MLLAIQSLPPISVILFAFSLLCLLFGLMMIDWRKGKIVPPPDEDDDDSDGVTTLPSPGIRISGNPKDRV